MNLTSSSFAAVCLAFAAANLAAISTAATIDLTTGGIGSTFDGQSSGFTGATGIAGLQMTVEVSSNDTTTTIEATTSGMGVDSGAINGDDEIFTFSFNLPVFITALDFSSVSEPEGTVDFSNDPTGDPFPITDNGATADDIDFASPIALPVGQSVTITSTATGNFFFERIHLETIPEPSSVALLALTAGCVFVRRRSL